VRERSYEFFILLTVDSLRADRTTSDCLGESLDLLNKDYVEFESAYSHGVATPFAFPGIMTGCHPEGDGLLPKNSITIAEGIPGDSTGYANNAHLYPERGYNRGFTTYEESPSVGAKGKLSVIDKIARRLQRVDVIRHPLFAKTVYNELLRDSLPIYYLPAEGMSKLVREKLGEETNEFVWGHWMDPHIPYHPSTAVDPPEYVPSLKELDDIKERISNADVSELTEFELEMSRELYDANVRYYDKHFSKLLRWMAKQPWYDDALIAVISDHGEYFGEHGQLFHTWDIDPYDEAVHTPMWVKYPDQVYARETFDHVVGHGDVLATVAEVLDSNSLKPPEHTAPLRDTSNRHVVSVSNTAKRLTEKAGVYFLRRDGSVKEHGTVSSSGKEFMNSIEFPECRNSEGKNSAWWRLNELKD
jgi:arylsulfatase A-like enzyme